MHAQFQATIDEISASTKSAQKSSESCQTCPVLRSEIARLSSALEQRASEREVRRKSLIFEDRVARLDASLGRAQRELERLLGLEAELAAAKAKLSDWESLSEALEGVRCAQDVRAAHVAATDRELDLLAEVSKQRSEVAVLTARYDEAERRCSSLKSALDAAVAHGEAKAREVLKLREELAMVKGTLEAKEGELSYFSHEAVIQTKLDLEAAVAREAELQRRLRQREEELAAANAATSKACAEVCDATTVNNDLKRQVAARGQAMEKQEQDLKEAAKKRTGLFNLFKRLRGFIEKLTNFTFDSKQEGVCLFWPVGTERGEGYEFTMVKGGGEGEGSYVIQSVPTAFVGTDMEEVMRELLNDPPAFLVEYMNWRKVEPEEATEGSNEAEEKSESVAVE
jgi:chromosome segregation ATPase